MNIKINDTKGIEDTNLQSLNEAEQDIIQETPDIPQQAQVEKVLSTKSKQFKFQSGAYMGGINSGIDELMFGLKYHAEHTNNFDEFLESVSNFVASSNIVLTDVDKKNLEQHYKKYWKK